MKIRKFVLVDDETGKVLSMDEVENGRRSFHISGIPNIATTL
jgi:hypothetical protein